MKGVCKVLSNNKIFIILLVIKVFIVGISTVSYASDAGSYRENISQNEPIIVRGVVRDASGEPLIGATVIVKGGSGGVVTNYDGEYSISIPSIDVTLVFSYIGYESQEIVLNGRNTIDVVLDEEVSTLQEVTVVGYGVQKKATLTGAISTIDTKELIKSPSASITNTLAGQLPGVSSIQSSGQPGADGAEIYVRGVGSLSEAGAKPLILVDGIERPFVHMDPNEIESISVLKDASATAVFGVRGANGVVLVTTRRGIEGKTSISVNSSVGVQMPTRLLHLADSYTYASLFNEAQANDGLPEDQWAFSNYALERFKLGDSPIMYPSVDWYDYLTKKSALQTRHNINISGGTSNIKYFVSLGYLFQDGFFKQLGNLDYNSNFRYDRFNYRSNLDVNLSKSTVLSLNIGGIVGNRAQPIASIWHLFSLSAPFSSPGVIDGKKVQLESFRYPGVTMVNQVFDYYYGHGSSLQVQNNMTLDLALSQDLSAITPGLSMELKGAYNTDYSYSRRISSQIETYAPYYLSEVDGSGLKIGEPGFDDTIVYRISGQNLMSVLSTGHNKFRGRDWYIEGSLRYNRQFGEHNIGGVLLYNQSKKYYPPTFTEVPTAYIGYVGRLTYDYKTKYLAELNIGYNGSENFAPEKRFGIFPAGSLGYIITEEDFVPKNDYLTYLKIRASIGLVGNDNMNNNRFLYLPTVYTINDNHKTVPPYHEINGYVFGLTNTEYEPAALEGRLGNSNVTWETALKQNIGLDAYFFRDRLKISADIFKEKRKDILIVRSTIPIFSGLNSKLLPLVNMGQVNNKGYEIDIKWGDKINDFKYSVNPNVSFSRNKIIYQDEVEPNEPYQWRTGNEVGARFGYVSLGFYNKDDFDEDGSLKDYLPQPKAQVYPGDVKFKDLNVDGILDTDDITKIGFPKRPAYIFGLNLNAEYKNIFMSMNWTGVKDADIEIAHAYRRPFNAGWTLYEFTAEGRWTPESADTAIYPRLSHSSTYSNGSSSRVWLKDVSYLKLKTASIGYNITDKRLLKAINASRLSLQLSGYNLLTFDKLKIFDPEGELHRDNNDYPIMKIFNFGVNVVF